MRDPFEDLQDVNAGLRLAVETAQAETLSAYRDRDVLLALLSSMYPAHLCHADDAWSLLSLQLPTGATVWPFTAAHRDLFAHVEAVPTDQLPEWDGVSSEERAERVRQFTYANAAGMGEPTPPKAVTAPQEPPEAAPAPKRRGRPRKSAQSAPDTATEA